MNTIFYLCYNEETLPIVIYRIQLNQHKEAFVDSVNLSTSSMGKGESLYYTLELLMLVTSATNVVFLLFEKHDLDKERALCKMYEVCKKLELQKFISIVNCW